MTFFIYIDLVAQVVVKPHKWYLGWGEDWVLACCHYFSRLQTNWRCRLLQTNFSSMLCWKIKISHFAVCFPSRQSSRQSSRAYKSRSRLCWCVMHFPITICCFMLVNIFFINSVIEHTFLPTFSTNCFRLLWQKLFFIFLLIPPPLQNTTWNAALHWQC